MPKKNDLDNPEKFRGENITIWKKFNSRLIQYLIKKSPGKKLIKRKQQTYGNLDQRES